MLLEQGLNHKMQLNNQPLNSHNMTTLCLQPRSFEQSFNNIVADFFGPTPSIYRNDATNRLTGHSVPANILKTENGYALELVAPGFEKDAFQISLEQGLLTVSATQPEAPKSHPDAFVRREFRSQSFKRSWSVDDSIDTAAITARYANGILTLALPKKVNVPEPVQRINIQ